MPRYAIFIISLLSSKFQKTEAFLDSKTTAQQEVALAAQCLIAGHLVKMNVYSMKNPDGSIYGYKASAAFTLKVNNVETGETTEAEHFQTSVSLEKERIMAIREIAVSFYQNQPDFIFQQLMR